MQVNMVSLVELTKRLLPGMLARKSGKVLNVGSVAGFQPGPFAPLYYASKAFVLSFSEGLSSALAGTGVTVSVLCPGATKTAFFDRPAAGSHSGGRKVPTMTARRVAELGYNGLMRGQTVIICGWTIRLLVFLERFLPRSLVREIVKKGQKG